MKKRFLITNLIVIIFVIAIAIYLGIIIEDKMIDYLVIELRNMSRTMINDTVRKDILDDIDKDKLFHINKNSNDEIEMIDFDTKVVNEIVIDINDKVTKEFNRLSNGENNKLFKNNKLLKNSLDFTEKNSIILSVPIGIVFSNPLLVNLGPKIPIKVVLVGEVDAKLKQRLDRYGINNVLLTINVEITIKEEIVMPFRSKVITCVSEVPLIIEMVQGQIPEIYSDTSGKVK